MKRLCLSFRGQGKWALLSAVILGALVSPFAIANDGDTMRVGAGNSAIEKETNISGQKVKTFATRQSNNLEGDGGSATYGCRSSFANEPCLDVFALRTARAFDFRSRGNEGGRIRVEGSPDPRNNKPFTTNATGVATGLNADEVDNLDASEIITAARAKLGLDADTLDGKDSTDFLLTTGKAADADKLDGKDSTDFVASADVNKLIPVAVVNISGNGTLRSESHRAPLTGAPVVSHTGGSNIYDIDLPGVKFFFSDDAANCTAADGDSKIASVASIGGDDVRIFVTTNAGVATEGALYCSIYNLK